jgi:excisionase family DNA binding protein
MDNQRFYLGREISALLRVKIGTVRRWREAGILEAIRFGRAWLYPCDQVDAALARQAAAQADHQAVEEPTS